MSDTLQMGHTLKCKFEVWEPWDRRLRICTHSGAEQLSRKLAHWYYPSQMTGGHLRYSFYFIGRNLYLISTWYRFKGPSLLSSHKSMPSHLPALWFVEFLTDYCLHLVDCALPVHAADNEGWTCFLYSILEIHGVFSVLPVQAASAYTDPH